MMKYKKIFLCIFFLISTEIQATMLILGNVAATPNTSPANNPAYTLSFNQHIVQKAFDYGSGTLYIGLDGSNQGGGLYGISFLPRPTEGAQYQTPTPLISLPAKQGITLQFQGMANDAFQKNATDFLTLATSTGNPFPFVIAAPVNTAGQLNQTSIFALTVTNVATVPTTVTLYPVISAQSSPLLAANPVLGANGPVTAGIAGIAANLNYAFVATFTGPSGSNFGGNESGIAVVHIQPQLNSAGQRTSIILNQVAAVPGDTGIKSVLFDPTISQIMIQNPVGLTQNLISMYWDDPLQRLYLGVQAVTGGMIGDGAKSVVVGRLDINEQGELTLDNFLQNSAIQQGNNTQLVGVIQDTLITFSLAADHLQVLHASTGPSYLIVNGGNGSISWDPTNPNGTVGNLIWAIPVVDVGDPSNPDQGKEADRNSYNPTTHRFETKATLPAQTTTSADEYAMVGDGPLPVQPYTPIWGVGSGSGGSLVHDTLDIVAVGDTVYVAIATPQTDRDDTGIFYSQAMFDNVGKIIRWTPWAKRAFPFNVFSSIPENKGRTRYVSVDPVIEKIIAVDGTLAQVAAINAWERNIFESTLPALLTENLFNGALSVLDLDQNVRSISMFGPNRYALFGGLNKVIFVVTTQSRTETFPYNITPGPGVVPAAQKLVSYVLPNGSPDPATFLVTPLPTTAGCVTSLEFSRHLGSNANYFFAGTPKGLFVFADAAGNGFNPTILDAPNFGALNKPPFSTGSWQLAPRISGQVIDIKSTGLSLYVLTTSQPVNGVITNTVYRIPYLSNISTMFAAGNIFVIAQTNTAAPGSDLSATKSFFAIQLITNSDDTSEQLVLATNNGLYQSSTVGGVQTATTQQAAAWHLIPGSAAKFFSGIGGIDTSAPATVWPFSLEDPTGCNLINRSSLYQLNGGTSTDPYAFVPVPFNANATTGQFSQFASFPPISYFTSDGTRRIFISNNQNNFGAFNDLEVSPYNVIASNIRMPTLITDQVLSGFHFFWVRQIGGTGLMLAGTQSGVVALE